MKKFYSFLILAIVASMINFSSAFGQIAQRGTATSASTTGTSLTINKPNGVLSGDIMLVTIAQVGNNSTDPVLSGWTVISGVSLAGQTQRRGAVLYRIADGTEGASFAFTLGSGVNAAVGSIVAFSGVNTATPFDVTPGTISVQGSQTGVVATGFTTVTANAAVVMFGMAANSTPTFSGWSTTSPGALTELFDNAGSNSAVGAAWAIKTTAGATGNGAATLSGAERNGGLMIALRPGTVAPSATLSPSATQTIAIGGSIAFTATANNYTGSGNYTFTWTAVGSTGSSTVTQAGNALTQTLSYAAAGSYTVQVTISRGATTLSTNTTTVTVLAPSVSISPSTTQNIAAGGSVSFTATAANFGGSGNYTYTWTAAGATIPGSNPNSIAAASDTKSLTYAAAGNYTVQVTISRGATTLSTVTITVNVLAAPASPNLWGIQGTNVVNFSVNGGVDFGAGPSVRFAQTVGTTSAALARTDQPTPVNGYFYWLQNTGTNGIVNVFGSTSTGTSQTNIGSLDVNGASNNTLGFVRWGARGDGTIYGIAGDGTTLYLFKFKPNGVTVNASLPVADQLQVEDASITLVGGAAATFQNGDLCLAGDGQIVALANDGTAITQIFVGAPNGASTTLTKKFDVLNQNGSNFTTTVNGVAFDLQGSLYVSTGDGLYFINKNTVNGPGGTINISQVWAGTGLTDLASNFFPFTIVTPVKMSSFTVKKQDNNAVLDWTTVTELNADRFEIERSYDGVRFEKVGSKQAAGNSVTDISYQFIDPIMVNSGIIYYRLRTVDVDSHEEYSRILTLRLSGVSLNKFTVYPNPFAGDLKVQVIADKASMATIRISNLAGQVQVNRTVNLQKGDNTFVLVNELKNLNAGYYIAELLSDGQKTNQMILKK